MKFSKVLKVKSPNRGHATDAGIDFFIPDFTEEFISQLKEKNSHILFNEDGIQLLAHQRILIPSGIKMNVPINHALIAFNKSGVASKQGLDLLASVVDHGYQGQIHISIYNTSSNILNLKYGSKIIQFILLPIKTPEVEECSEEELFIESSNRGEGGFGSTGV